MLGRALCCVLLLCLARVDAQCNAGYAGLDPASNRAKSKTVAFSTVYNNDFSNYSPLYAVDGNKITMWYSASGATPSYLGVDLSGSALTTYFVNFVRFYFSQGIFSDNYIVRLGLESAANRQSNPICNDIFVNTGTGNYIDINCGATGRWLTIERKNNGFMIVVELEAYSTPVCSACAAGKYKSTTDTEVCTNCPANSISASGSTAATSCQCNAGYTGPDGGTCTACQSGKYKSIVGTGSCPQCGYYLEDATSPVGSTSRSQCICSAGKGFTTLQGEGGGFVVCRSCGSNSWSVEAPINDAICTCNAGYVYDFTRSDGLVICKLPGCAAGTYLSGSSCVNCDAGTYKVTTGTEACTNCAANTYSSAGSTAVTSCLCNAGYTGPDGGTCTACAIGQYKSTVGSGSCTYCNYETRTTFQTGSTSANDCVCIAGYYSTSCFPCETGKYKSTIGFQECSPCDVGKYNEFGAASECQACPAGSSTSGTGAFDDRDCKCIAGYYGTNFVDGAVRTCSPCESGKFKNLLSNSECTQCVANTYQPSTGSATCLPCYTNSLQPSLGSITCLCNAGYTGPAGGPCVQCEAGKYKNTPGSEACTDCQAPKTSPAGSTDASSCVCPSGLALDAATQSVCVYLCDMGKYGTTTGCEDCPFGYYKPGYQIFNTQACTACPTGSTTSYGGRTSRDDCFCVGQYVKNNLSPWTCQYCNAGQHRYSSTSNDCWNCVQTYWSVPGGSCQCNVGYTGASDYSVAGSYGGLCSQCPAGKYKNTLGSVSCTNCEEGKYTSTPGATICTKCPAGQMSYGTGNTACTPCPLNTWKGSAYDYCIQCYGVSSSDSTLFKYQSVTLTTGTTTQSCLCPPGWIGPGETQCKACEVGTAQETPNQLPYTYYSQINTRWNDKLAMCEACPAGKISGVNGTFLFLELPVAASKCTNCEAGKYSWLKVPATGYWAGGPSATSCSTCPSTRFSEAGSSSPTACGCKAGTTGATPTAQYYSSDITIFPECTLCPAGTYKSILGSAACSACPLGQTSLAGSTSLTDCRDILKCNAGYTGPDDGLCTACAAGKFKAVIGSAACTDCSANTYSTTTGATSSSMCLACPVNTVSVPGSSQNTNCLCNAGYSGPDGGLCTACPAATYKSTLGSGSCVACPAFSVSANSSTLVSNCQCQAGYTGPNGGTCTACQANFYKDTVGPAACSACPVGTTSPASSVASTACICGSNSYMKLSNLIFPVGIQRNYVFSNEMFESCAVCYDASYSSVTAVSNIENCKNTAGTQGMILMGSKTSTASTSFELAAFIKGSDFITSSSLTVPYISNGAYWYYHTTKSVGFTSETTINLNPYDQDVNTVIQICPPWEACPVTCLNLPTDVQGRWILDGRHDTFYLSGSGTHIYKNWITVDMNKKMYVTKITVYPYVAEYWMDDFYVRVGNDVDHTKNPICATCNGPVGAGSRDFDCNMEGRYLTMQQFVPGPMMIKEVVIYGYEKICRQKLSWNLDNNGGGRSECATGLDTSEVWRKMMYTCFNGAACISCPANSAAPAQSTNRSSCLCNAGYTGPNGGPCIECDAGKYKSVTGSTLCSNCPADSISASGSTAVTSCQCKAGYTGLNGGTCTACLANFYKDTVGPAACSACPANSASPAASNASTSCLCNLGYTGANGGTCTACQANFYKDAVGAAACSACPANSASPAASTVSTSCQCNAGYTGPNGGTCTACQANFYKDAVGPAACSACPANSTSPAASTASTSCQCNAGYTGPNGGTCTACQANFYKNTVGAAACSACPANSTSPAASTASTSCQCNAGYTGPNGGTCTACQANFYKNTVGAAACSACPANTVSPAASTASTSCLCNLGYTGPNGGTCTACNDTQYKDTVGSSPCSTCKANSVSGCKHSASCCACNLGYSGGVGQQCTICTADTYSDVTGASACTPCPANTSAPAGSSSVYSCECLPGHVGSLGSACAACVAGTYKQSYNSCANCPANTYSTQVAAVSVATCQACPRNSTSVAGSGRIEMCFCVAGYRQTAGHDACVACEPGYYDEVTKRYECSRCAGGLYSASVAATGSEVCQDCPAGKWSPPGSPSCELCPALSHSSPKSANITDCKCTAGATGADGQTCTSCVAGKYKDVTGSAACALCPESSQSVAGSDEKSDCKCNMGYSGQDGGPCPVCNAATYKSSVGSQACTSCPSNASSPAGSTKLTDCKCPAGFAGADGQSCTSCPQNTYKDELDPTACDDCPLNSQSPSGSALVTDCRCNAGYTGANGSPCQACLAGTFKKSVGPETCSECPADSSNPAGSSVCTCNPGFTGPDDAECSACVAGKYKEASGSAACLRCPDNSNSTPASTAQSSCLCDAGYSGPSEGPCAACGTGTYKPAAGSAACESCPEHATPSLDSAAASCECKSGYRLAGGVCGACAVGTFKEQAGNASKAGSGCFPQDGCCQCPMNRTTLSPSTVQSVDCLCLPGFGGAACQPCAAGSYKTDVSMDECASCPPGATTLQTRSSAEADCVAAKGHYGNVTAGFAPCAGGTYAPSTAMQRCLLCPPGATGPVGAEREAQCACELPGWTRTESAAVACTCLPGYARAAETGLCQACPADHYCPGGDLPAQACPAASLAAPGSAERTDCVCAAGHSGEDGGPCEACAEGEWKAVNGSADCTQCPANALSPAASTDPSACLCVAGHSGEDGGPCAACETGTYKPGVGAEACVACPANTTTLEPASTDASECVCTAGFGNVSGVCVPCPAGRFKATAGTGQCGDACPPFSASPEGSDSRADCVCNAGYSGDAANSSCEVCPVGTHKGNSGSAACVACAGNATTRAEGSTSTADCACVLGFAATETGACTPCAAGFFGVALPGAWAAQTGGDGCLPCLANSFSEAGSDDGLECLCELGFEFVGMDPATNATICAACPLGKYIEAHARPQVCKQCPPSTTTAAVGAQAADECVCVPGRHLVSGTLNASSCELCPTDTFKDFAGDDACTACPPHTAAPRGSNSSEACQCLRGFGVQDVQVSGQPEACEACKAGEYKAELGNIPCSKCPLHSMSPPTSEDVKACVCDAAFNGPPGGPCEACSAGKYTVNNTCVGCPEHTESPSGALLLTDCTCLPGYSGVPGGPCTPCAVGYYRARADAECLPCPATTYTVSTASTSADACLASQGYEPVLVQGPFVELAFELPYSLEEFTPDLQLPIRRAVADMANKVCDCGITSQRVVILSIANSRSFAPTRRLLQQQTEYSNVVVAISPNNITDTAKIATGATSSELNNALYDQGVMPASELQPATIRNENLQVNRPCPGNFYKPVVNNTLCLPCRPRSTSREGSTRPEDCQCMQGFIEAGDGSCDRVCAPGFQARGGADGEEACTGCLPGSYKPNSGSEDCTPCPAHTVSYAYNQTSVTSCLCEQGYIRNAQSLLCEACPAGSFNNRVNDTECFNCTTVCPT